MKRTFFIDGDNNVTKGLTGIDLLTKDDTVMIFHKKKAALTRIKKNTQDVQADVQFIESVQDGKNSIDFQIVAELGVMIGKNLIEYAYIISHDQGYVSSIAALLKRYPKACKEIALKESIEQCLQLPFVIRATTKKELNNSLVKEYGMVHGSLLYNHLKTLFSKTDEHHTNAKNPPANTKQTK